MQRERQRNHMRGADEADRNGIGDRSLATGERAIETVAVPRRARDIDEGAALRQGLKVTLARGHERSCQFGNLTQASLISKATLNRSRRATAIDGATTRCSGRRWFATRHTRSAAVRRKSPNAKADRTIDPLPRYLT